jgi:hypothetical protein
MKLSWRASKILSFDEAIVASFEDLSFGEAIVASFEDLVV